jgi:hypothetical protein
MPLTIFLPKDVNPPILGIFRADRRQQYHAIRLLSVSGFRGDSLYQTVYFPTNVSTSTQVKIGH